MKGLCTMKRRGRPTTGLRLGEEFPARLYNLRCSLKKVPTQEELARELGISRTYYNLLEGGKVASVSKVILRRIADHFDMKDHLTLARGIDEDLLCLKPKSYRNGNMVHGKLMNVGAGFPDRLYEARWEMEFTQKEFGERVGVGLSTINRLEMGRRLPTEETFNRIIAVTGKDEMWLYGSPLERKLLERMMETAAPAN